MRTIIIAEAGVNHNGEIQKAFDLVDAASNAGADYIKFQTFITEKIIDPSAQLANYQLKGDAKNNSQFDLVKKLELSINEFKAIKKYCIQKKIKFLTSTADLTSLENIQEFNLDFIKIASGEITNTLFLKKVAKINKPVILSTGLSNLGEIEYALNILIEGGLNRNDITILHCNTEYPTPYADVNLLAMKTIKDAFKVKIGYSDHTLGIEVGIAAVALGATIIEKHITLDNNLKGPDHKSSLEPHEFCLLVNSIRNIEAAIAPIGIKEISQSEKKNRLIVRKSIFSACDILKGEVITEDKVEPKRPGDGIPANQIDIIIGHKAIRNITCGEKLHYKDILW